MSAMTMTARYFLDALRSLRQRPVSAAIKLLALALGLTCLLTAHIIGDYFRQADRQWAKAERIYVVVQENALPGGGWRSFMDTASAALAGHLRAEFPELEAVARMSLGGAGVESPASSHYWSAQGADPELLDMFDLDMVSGEARLDRPRTALLDEEAAITLFGRSDVAGETLTLEGGFDVSIAGVFRPIAPPSHLTPSGGMAVRMITDMVTSDDTYPGAQGMRPSEQEDFRIGTFLTYVLLPEDGSLSGEAFNRRLEAFAERRGLTGPMGSRFRAVPVTEISQGRFNARVGKLFGASATTALYLLGALTLAVGCFNFANLAAAEAANRARETGLRKTLGAARAQVAGPALAESAILVAAALVLVLPLAFMLATVMATRFNIALVLPDASRLDYWLGVAAIAVAAAIAAGAYPALALAGLRPAFAIRIGGLGRGGGAIRTLLIGAQFAVAGFLLPLVAVMLAQKADLRGFAVRAGDDPIVSVGMSLGPTVMANQQGTGARMDDIHRRLVASPAISGATFKLVSAFTQLSGLEAEYAQSTDPESPRIPGQGRGVYYDYFEVTGTPLLAGRVFSRELDESRSVIIDESTARLLGYSPGEAIGQPVYRLPRPGPPGAAPPAAVPEFTIVGVVEREPLELRTTGPSNFLYVLQPAAGSAIVRLSQHDVEGGLAHIDAVWREMELGSAEPAFLDAAFDTAFRSFSMLNTVFVVLSAITVAIAAMGQFGMASFAAQRRVREIGIRKTLGASRGRVMAMMIRDFSWPVLLANLLAWPLAWMAAQAYLNLFVSRIELSPTPFLAALGFTLLVAWLAVGAHAWSAARVRPALVLRSE